MFSFDGKFVIFPKIENFASRFKQYFSGGENLFLLSDVFMNLYFGGINFWINKAISC